MTSEPSKIHYLNTDLDLVSADDLTPLADALAARGVRALSVEQGGGALWYAILEIKDYIEPDKNEPEVAILIMLDAIEATDGHVRKLWDECTKREFNIGYDCGDEPWGFNNGLTNSTLKRIADAGATLRITIYPYRSLPDDVQSSQ